MVSRVVRVSHPQHSGRFGRDDPCCGGAVGIL